jgi:hypothetical protein
MRFRRKKEEDETIWKCKWRQIVFGSDATPELAQQLSAGIIRGILLLLRRRQQRLFFPRVKLCRVSLLQQGGGRLRAGDSLQRDHRDR